MAASIGRNLKVKRGSTVIAGVRTKSGSFAGEPVDVTTDDENGFRTTLEEAGTYSFDLSVEGITKDNDIRSAALGATNLMLTDVNLEWPNGDTLTGNFFLASLEESGEYNGALTFTASLQSSGEWTYTAASA